MSVDLKLLPFYPGDSVCYSHIILDLTTADYALWDEIQKVEDSTGRPVREDFMTFLSRDGECEETHYGVTTETPYGKPLMYVPVSALAPLAAHPAVAENWPFRAAWAYLRELPDAMKVALYWN